MYKNVIVPGDSSIEINVIPIVSKMFGDHIEVVAKHFRSRFQAERRGIQKI